MTEANQKCCTCGLRFSHVVIGELGPIARDNAGPYAHVTVAYLGERDDAEMRLITEEIPLMRLERFDMRVTGIAFYGLEKDIKVYTLAIDCRHAELMLRWFYTAWSRPDHGIHPATPNWHVSAKALEIELRLGDVLKMDEAFVKELGPVDPFFKVALS